MANEGTSKRKLRAQVAHLSELSRTLAQVFGGLAGLVVEHQRKPSNVDLEKRLGTYADEVLDLLESIGIITKQERRELEGKPRLVLDANVEGALADQKAVDAFKGDH